MEIAEEIGALRLLKTDDDVWALQNFVADLVLGCKEGYWPVQTQWTTKHSVRA
jgi:hypothetical protein